MGGGGPEASLLDDYVLSLAPAREPRICLLPTAGGDSEEQIRRFSIAFGDRLCETSHLSLFRLGDRPVSLRDHLLGQDIIYVGGGSVLSLLGVWRAHGIDSIVREAWERGVILCGVSAGSLCWFAEGVTAFHGQAQPFTGLGLLPWSNTVHYQAEHGRGDEFRRMLLGGMAPGFAAEDGTALHFHGEKLHRVVTSRSDARAFRMRCTSGRVARKPLRATYLGGEEQPRRVAQPSIVLAPEPAAAAAG